MRKTNFHCVAPPFLRLGDRIALVSPSYHTPMENVTGTAEVLRGWGFEPVVGPHVGRIEAGQYAGTLDERVADLRWALSDPSVKAIICNRGGYGTIRIPEEIGPNELARHPKWLVGYSDITTLLGMEACAGVMSVHGTMSSSLAPSKGVDETSLRLRDLLLGRLPVYELQAHPENRPGKASGVLVGGNLSTFVPLLGTWADVTAREDFILFVEDVEESMHHIDRLFNMLRFRNVFTRCRGVILGEFTDCGSEFDYGSVEAMLSRFLAPYGIPVLCGFPAGHGPVNLPLVMGAPVTMDVRPDGSALKFGIIH